MRVLIRGLLVLFVVLLPLILIKYLVRNYLFDGLVLDRAGLYYLF